jgi:hypothetical protein
MCLVEIKVITKRPSGYYLILLDGARLAVTSLHAFLLVDGTAESTQNLKPGNKIWVDASAFQADHSLAFDKPKPKSNIYQFPKKKINSLVKI